MLKLPPKLYGIYDFRPFIPRPFIAWISCISQDSNWQINQKILIIKAIIIIIPAYSMYVSGVSVDFYMVLKNKSKLMACFQSSQKFAVSKNKTVRNGWFL